jgi:hypothetical protein
MNRRLIRTQFLVLFFVLQFHWMGVFQEIYEVAGPYARPSSSQSLNSSHHHSHNHTKYPRLLVPPEETRRRSVKSGHNIHPLYRAGSELPIFHYRIDYYGLHIFVNHQTSSSAAEFVLQQQHPSHPIPKLCFSRSSQQPALSKHFFSKDTFSRYFS